MRHFGLPLSSRFVAWKAFVPNLLHPPPFNDNKGWGLEYKITLAWLDLRLHWQSLRFQRHCRSRKPDPNDLYMLENPGMSASPLAPFRKSWNQVVKRQARILAESEHSKWLDKTDHRACSFKTKTLSCLSDIPKVYVKASWLALHLPTPIAQRLLRRRVLATDLDTRTPSSRKN
jgi:hypothetical protein